MSTADPGGPLEAVLLELADAPGDRSATWPSRPDADRLQALTADAARAAPGSRTAGPRKAVGKKRRTARSEGYQPIPAPRWWQLQGRERAEAVARLRAWVETVFRPGYGHLAEQVGPCWEQHDLCLYQLAWLSEMHTVIFLAPGAAAGQRGRLAHPAPARRRGADGRGDRQLRPPAPRAGC